LLGKRLQGERLSHAKAAMQVLMQTGRMCVSESNGCDWARTVDEPILSRATFLATTSADCILEAILRRYPIPLDDAAAVSGLGGSTGSVVLAFSHDRAASNYVVLRWICSQFILPAIPRNIYPHAEACVLHGLQLVRTRPAAGKPLIGAAFSLTRFFRNWKSMAGMRSEIIAFVRTHLEVVPAPCPEGVATRDEAVLKVLFADRPAPAIGQPNRVTQSELKFLEDVQAVVRLVPLSRDGLRHNCPPADVPVQPGVPARKPCCKNREDSVEKGDGGPLEFVCSSQLGGWHRKPLDSQHADFGQVDAGLPVVRFAAGVSRQFVAFLEGPGGLRGSTRSFAGCGSPQQRRACPSANASPTHHPGVVHPFCRWGTCCFSHGLTAD